ncbi:MAG: hypothetical protein DI629_02880 [Mesorhizobium amorphae]|nr:MAG: hypothetical protein DI629_02880 [Mesorhizobium amorphae]
MGESAQPRPAARRVETDGDGRPVPEGYEPQPRSSRDRMIRHSLSAWNRMREESTAPRDAPATDQPVAEVPALIEASPEGEGTDKVLSSEKLPEDLPHAEPTERDATAFVPVPTVLPAPPELRRTSEPRQNSEAKPTASVEGTSEPSEPAEETAAPRRAGGMEDVHAVREEADARPEAPARAAPLAQPAPASPSPPPPAPLAVDATPPGLAEAIRADLAQRPIDPAVFAGPDTRRVLVIELRPAELGAVTARLRFTGGAMQVELSVETERAHERLGGDGGDAILRALQAAGVSVDQVTVQAANPAQAPPDMSSRPPPTRGDEAQGNAGPSTGREGRGSEGEHGHGERSQNGSWRNGQGASPSRPASRLDDLFI